MGLPPQSTIGLPQRTKRSAKYRDNHKKEARKKAERAWWDAPVSLLLAVAQATNEWDENRCHVSLSIRPRPNGAKVESGVFGARYMLRSTALFSKHTDTRHTLRRIFEIYEFT